MDCFRDARRATTFVLVPIGPNRSRNAVADQENQCYKTLRKQRKLRMNTLTGKHYRLRTIDRKRAR